MKGVEESGVGLSEGLSKHLSGGTVENHKNSGRQPSMG